LGEHVQPGTIIVLSGDLGAGKTQLAAAIALGLGIDEAITSPTFAILKNYPQGRIPLNHMDLYRLESAAQLDDLDFWDLLHPDDPSTTLIEWGDMFSEVLSRADLVVTLRIVDHGHREINLQSHTKKGETLLTAAFSCYSGYAETLNPNPGSQHMNEC